MAKIFIALLSFCFLSLAWDTPKLIETDYNSSIAGIYYDEFSKRLLTRYLRLGSIGGNFEVVSGIKPYYQDKTFGKFTPISTQKMSQITSFGSLAGADKGKIMFSIDNLAFDRGASSVTLDICFSESLDYGKTWSKPVFVPRPNMSDLFNRAYPSFIYIKETRRIYIFYAKTDESKRVFSNMYVTRAPNSKKFSNEREIKLPNLKETVASVTYNLKNHKPLIHLVWIEKDKIWYSKSFDALRWSEPRTVLQNAEGGLGNKLIAGKNNELFYTFYATKTNMMNITFTENPEGKWSTPVAMFKDYEVTYPLPDTTYCINPKGEESIFTTVAEFDFMRVAQFSSNTKEVRNFDWPEFSIADKGPSRIACSYDRNTQKYNVYVTFTYSKESFYNISSYVTMESIPQ